MARISAIVLAAGKSKRFQKNKLLYSLNGKPLYQYLLETLQKVSLDEVIIVSQYAEIASYTRSCGWTYVYNNQSHLGISHSLKMGVLQAKPANHLLFLTADAPYIKASTIEHLIAHLQEDVPMIIASCYQDTLYQPNLFHRAFREDLLQIEGDRGGKVVMDRYASQVMPVAVADAREIKDIDYQEDLLDKKDHR